MLIQKAFKFRIYPTEEQQAELAIQFGHARFVYNASLALRKDIYFSSKETFSYEDCANALVEVKKNNPDLVWLKQADSQVLQQALKDLDAAYQRYFRMHAEGTLPKPGKKPRKDGMPKGYPSFHRKFDKQSIRYPQRFVVKKASIYLPKVGWVRLVRHRPLEGTQKSATVSKTKSGQYFVSIQCQVETPEPRDRSDDPEIGIDLGLKDFITPTEGEKIPAPKFYRNAERTLKIRQRRLSRKLPRRKHESKEKKVARLIREKAKQCENQDHGPKPEVAYQASKSSTKAAKVLAITHEKIRNRRTDFQHKLSRQLVNAYGLIAFEDLNIKGMMANHNLAKSIGDAGWAHFVNFVTYKQAWAGGEVKHVDRFFPSSKLCNDCGHKNTNLKMHNRSWVCTNCGTIHDRDTNAAINILVQATQGAWESNAVGHMSSAVRRSAPEQVQGTFA